MSFSNVIAIDGPSGSGKSSVAKELARTLNILYIDTGAMFRALAYVADQRKIPFQEGPELSQFLNRLKINYGVSDSVLITVDDENLTEKIREHHVSKLASIISQLPSVRTFLLNFQRSLAQGRLCVMEGRDIGTVVFPDAFVKFFVTASVETRASRRLKQLQESGDHSVTMDQLVLDVQKRDDKDMGREFAPLKKADDAQLVDTNNLNFDQVIQHLKNQVMQKASQLGIRI